jgi:fructosamine-3-kinase
VILTACQDLPPTTESLITIQTPKIYPFKPETNTQIYSDLALSTDLKTYALTNTLTHSECARLGFALGRWIKNFHTWGAAPEQASLREKMKESTEMRALKYQINYPTMVATIANFPEILEESREIFEAVAKDIKDRLDSEDGDLIHGDFWTGKYVDPICPLFNSYIN